MMKKIYHIIDLIGKGILFWVIGGVVTFIPLIVFEHSEFLIYLWVVSGIIIGIIIGIVVFFLIIWEVLK